MLNPSALRRKTEEAVARIERERQMEEERRRLEAERQRELERKREEQRQLVLKTKQKMLGAAISAAAKGLRQTTLEVPPDILADVCEELRMLSLPHSTQRSTKFNRTLQERLRELAQMLGDSPKEMAYKDRLRSVSWADVNLTRQQAIDKALDLVDALTSDNDLVLSSETLKYISFSVKRYLLSHAGDEPVTSIQLRWEPRDVVDRVMNELHQVPSWLLSTGGAWMIQRIGQCLASDAERGQTASTFELQALPVTPGRWGQNEMTKYVHRGEPVGVCPFAPNVLSQALEFMGFKVAVAESSVPQTLTIRW